MLQTIEVPVVLIRLVELGQSVSSLSDQNTASIFKIMIIFVSAKSPICRWSLLYFHFISSLLISLVSLRYLIWPLLNLHRYTRLGTFAWALNVSKGASHHLSSKYKRVEISRFQKAFLKFEQKQTSIIYFLILLCERIGNCIGSDDESLSFSELSASCWTSSSKILFLAFSSYFFF